MYFVTDKFTSDLKQEYKCTIVIGLTNFKRISTNVVENIYAKKLISENAI